MSAEELFVFQGVEQKKMSWCQMADILGCSLRSVDRIVEKIRRKGIHLHKRLSGSPKKHTQESPCGQTIAKL